MRGQFQRSFKIKINKIIWVFLFAGFLLSSIVCGMEVDGLTEYQLTLYLRKKNMDKELGYKIKNALYALEAYFSCMMCSDRRFSCEDFNVIKCSLKHQLLLCTSEEIDCIASVMADSMPPGELWNVKLYKFYLIGVMAKIKMEPMQELSVDTTPVKI